jgi:phage terminase Nu1 subunit (DNA packaging protein)
MVVRLMGKRTKSTQAVADLFDVDPSTVQGWVKQGCPCDPAKTKKQSHKFDDAEVAAWMEANKRTGKVGRPADEMSDELKQLKIRKETALVAKYERENAIEDGKLIDAATEQQRDIRKITTIRNRLCGLGASISPQLDGLDGAERQSVIDQSIEEILKDFASE